jgi:general secretion pathway protein G
MNRDRRRNAFTLIEVLIVVIIMSILAATIIPQFSSSTTDARKSSVNFNAQAIRSQIEAYRHQHTGIVPAFATFSDQMTKPTDATGKTAGTNLIYGPYIQGQLPVNPFTSTNTLVKVATPGAVPAGVVAGSAGWQYDESNGGFYPNNAEYYQAGF